jgi:hypothetical protein
MPAWLRRQWLADLAAVYGVDVGYQYEKVRDRALMAVAWHLPRRLVLWCAVRVVAHATTGAYGETLVPHLSGIEALERWPVGRPHDRVGHSPS